MSEETTNTTTAGTGERAGFCQDCGKPLTRETIRTVGTGVFCEPCLGVRIGAPTTSAWQVPSSQPVSAQPGSYQPGGYQGAAASFSSQPGPSAGGPATGSSSSASSSGWAPVGSAPPAGGFPPPPPPGGFTPAPQSHLPNPTLAAVLGVIPGVGAMYNGQFVKGLLHFGVFGILVFMSNNVSGVFGFFVVAWEMYQIFDAYHTARARRDGTHIPDFLGMNDLANKIGSGQGWTEPGRPAGTPGAGYAGAPPTAADAPPPADSTWSAPVPPTAVPPAPGYGAYQAAPVPPTNWAGYTHPANVAVPSPPPPVYPPAPGYPTAYPGSAAPPAPNYADTFVGTDPSLTTVPPAKHRFPVGALWLIAGGILVLAGNLSSEWRISGLWVLAGLFAALAVWSLLRRLEWAGGYGAVADGEWLRLAGMLRAPILLLTISVLFVLQAAHIATLGQTWPVFPIAFGVALLLERTIGATPLVPVPPPGAYYGTPQVPAPAVPVPTPAAASEADVQR